jgi:hypothetical protein
MKKLLFCLLFLSAVGYADEVRQLQIDSVNLGGKHIKPKAITTQSLNVSGYSNFYSSMTVSSNVMVTGDLTVLGVTAISGSTVDHGTLAGLGDDDHTQYLTEARHTSLAGEHVTNGDSHDHSGGDGAQISHSGLSNLSSDDHTQYLLANGTRNLTADWNISNYEIISSSSISADKSYANQLHIGGTLGTDGIFLGTNCYIGANDTQGAVFIQPLSDDKQSAIHLLPPNGTWPLTTINEFVLNRQSEGFGGNYGRLSLTNIGNQASGGAYYLHQETGGTVDPSPVKFSLGDEDTPGNFNSYIYMTLMNNAGDLGNVLFGEGSTGSMTSRDVIQMQVGGMGGVAGYKDSHRLKWAGVAYDGATNYNVDWRAYANVSSNTGSSTFILQTRVGGAAYTNKLSVTDSGNLSVKNIFVGEANNDYIRYLDNCYSYYGSAYNYVMGYRSASDDFRIAKGSISDANTAFSVKNSSYVCIGIGTGATQVDGQGDLFVQDELEVKGNAYFFGFTQLYSRTEAELKAITPTAAGQIYYDSTNYAVVVSTGTGVGAFGLITDGTQQPTGW